jgi:hypothetical protein
MEILRAKDENEEDFWHTEDNWGNLNV